MRGFAAAVAGFVMAVILLIALSAVTVSFVKASSRTRSAEEFYRSVDVLKEQSQLIGSAVWLPDTNAVFIRVKNDGSVVFEKNSVMFFVDARFVGRCESVSCSGIGADGVFSPGEILEVNIPLGYPPDRVVLSVGPVRLVLPVTPWLSRCHYRRAVVLYNGTGQYLRDYQIRVELNTDSFDYAKVSSDGSDIVFTDANGNVLPKWREEWNTSGKSIIWTKADLPPGYSYIVMQYGGCEPQSDDGDAVFLFFDDFSTDPNANGKWEIYRGVGDLNSECAWDPINGYMYVTKAVDGRGCMAFAASRGTAVRYYPSFAIEFRYFIGGGTGADGLTIAFDKDVIPYRNSGVASTGGSLALEAGGTLSDGYAVEFDNHQNSGDPSANHVALVRTNVGHPYTHIAYVNTLVTEDNTWHRASVHVLGNGPSWVVDTVVDGNAILSSVEVNALNYLYTGVSAGTDGLTNDHILDFIFIRNYAYPEPVVTLQDEQERNI